MDNLLLFLFNAALSVITVSGAFVVLTTITIMVAYILVFIFRDDEIVEPIFDWSWVVNAPLAIYVATLILI